ncbi:MAG: CoA transferase, partial [Rhodobacteraceae bacterium]|nr:CoA transferase [Paracoccaceae bacterium]
MSDPTNKGILHGIRVLDLSRMLSGPYCTMMLADHGAEVIKIEGPGGDTSRGNGPFRDDDPNHDWAGYFVSLNRSKKSVQLDLKTEQGKAAFRTFAATADVVVENFRPGVMERLGLSYESLADINPRLVYGAIRGFGDPRSGASPYADWPSYDVVAQAMGGIMSLTGPDAATPTKVGPGVGDVFSGLMMAFGIMAALRQAEATGRGQFVDVAMYDAMISLCERAVYLHDFDGSVPGPEGNGHPFLAPFGLFPAADGAVSLGIVDDTFWRALAGAMKRPELGQDTRFATRAARSINADALNAIVSGWTATQTKAELSAGLGGVVPFGPMNTIADIFADPHVAARAMLAQVPHADPNARPWTVAANPLRFSAAPNPQLATPPRLGADTEKYLAEHSPASMSDSEKRDLRDAFGAFATGVTVVTTRQSDGTPRGFTANSFTSVSLDPPLVLVCVAKSAHSCDVFTGAEHFAINVLGEDQRSVSGLFASQNPDKFDIAEWDPGTADMPLIRGSLASFICLGDKVVDAGDHIILLGKVIDFSVQNGAPLGYFRGSYFSASLEHTLVSTASKTGESVIGAVVSRGDKLLLVVAPDGSITVPTAPETMHSLVGLKTMLQKTGLSAELDFLYAVYHDRETGIHGIYYHGSVTGKAPAGMAFVAIDRIPLERVSNLAERSMLARYSDEFTHGNFGIYQGNETRGIVSRVTTENA